MSSAKNEKPEGLEVQQRPEVWQHPDGRVAVVRDTVAAQRQHRVLISCSAGRLVYGNTVPDGFARLVPETQVDAVMELCDAANSRLADRCTWCGVDRWMKPTSVRDGAIERARAAESAQGELEDQRDKAVEARDAATRRAESVIAATRERDEALSWDEAHSALIAADGYDAVRSEEHSDEQQSTRALNPRDPDDLSAVDDFLGRCLLNLPGDALSTSDMQAIQSIRKLLHASQQQMRASRARKRKIDAMVCALKATHESPFTSWEDWAEDVVEALEALEALETLKTPEDQENLET